MIELFARLPGVMALLLAFAMLLAGRSWPWLYVAQSLLVALTALVTATVSGQVSLLAAVPVLLVQAFAIPRLLRFTPPPTPPAPLGTLAVGLLLAMLAACVPFAEGFAAPLSMVLLGLLGAARAQDAGAMRFGGLLVLTGAEAAMCAAPANPTGPLVVLVLAGVASIVACEGLPRWSALR